MTTKEFVAATISASSPEYWSLTELADIDDGVKTELDKAINTIQTARDSGCSIISLPKRRPIRDDEREIVAAVDVILNDKVLQAAITAYHKQLSREAAVIIVKGANALAKQPGSCYNGPGLVDALPFYTVNCLRFIDDWNSTHPEEEPIPWP